MATQEPQLIEDIGGGLNTRLSPNKISINQTPDTINFWYDNQSLIKRGGNQAVSTKYYYPAGQLQGSFVSYNIFVHPATGDFLICAGVLQGAPSIPSTIRPVGVKCLLQIDPSDLTVALDILRSTIPPGTVTLTVGSPTVTGSGTTFLTDFRTGSVLSPTFGVFAADYYVVLTVTNDTTMTLAYNATFSQTNASYRALTGWPVESQIAWVPLGDFMYVTGHGGTAVKLRSSDNAFAFVDAMPQARSAIVYKNYVFTSNTINNPTRVQWSALADPDTWPASNFIDVAPEDGHPIVGMFSDGQSIIVVKTTSAFRITGDIFDPSNPTYTLVQIGTPSDFIASGTRSVQLFKDQYIILCKSGFYGYDGNAFKYLDISDSIKDQFSGISGFSLNSGAPDSQDPVSAIIDGNYWLQVASTLYPNASPIATKNVSYIIDKLGKIWRFTYATSNYSMLNDLTSYNNVLYGTSTEFTSGVVTVNTATSDGLPNGGAGILAIQSLWKSKVFEFGNMRRFGLAYVYFKKQSAGNLTFSYSIDEGSFIDITIDMTVGNGTRVKSAPIIIGRVGNTIQFKFQQNGLSQLAEIYAIEYFTQELRQ